MTSLSPRPERSSAGGQDLSTPETLHRDGGHEPDCLRRSYGLATLRATRSITNFYFHFICYKESA